MAKFVDMKEMIKELYQAYENDVEPTVDDLKAILNGYKSNPKDWKKYVTWSDICYTRNLIDKGNGKFNLLALCWSPSQGSPIHDHSNSHCLVKVLDGKLMETLFRLPSDSCSTEQEPHEMEQVKQTTYENDQVTYIHDNQGVAHRMENPSHSDGTVSLHLYTPPFMTCRKFDDRTCKATEVKMSFTTEYGKPVEAGNQCCGSSCK